MKSKPFKRYYLLYCIGIACALALLLFAAIIFSGNQITIARCVVTDNNSLYMVYEERPVHLSFNGHNEYKTGDNLLIIHQSAFAESYPEQTRAYFIVKLGSGYEKDIPQKALDILIETGNYSLSDAGGMDGPQSTYGTVQLLEKKSDTEESSYLVGATFPAADFSTVGQVLSDKIAQEWKIYDGMTEAERLASSKLWGCVGIQTDTWNECEQTIGFAVKNPLASLDWLNKTGYVGMESADPNVPVKHILINANSALTTDRKVNEINVTAGYNVEDIRITLRATLSANAGTYTNGSICNGYATYEEATTTTGTGIPVLIVTTNETNNNGYYNADYFDPTAYWVKDNVFYTLRVFGEETNKEEIQTILYRILGEI